MIQSHIHPCCYCNDDDDADAADDEGKQFEYRKKIVLTPAPSPPPDPGPISFLNAALYTIAMHIHNIYYRCPQKEVKQNEKYKARIHADQIDTQRVVYFHDATAVRRHYDTGVALLYRPHRARGTSATTTYIDERPCKSSMSPHYLTPSAIHPSTIALSLSFFPFIRVSFKGLNVLQLSTCLQHGVRSQYAKCLSGSIHKKCIYRHVVNVNHVQYTMTHSTRMTIAINFGPSPRFCAESLSLSLLLFLL